jgi:hypothetical protein
MEGWAMEGGAMKDQAASRRVSWTVWLLVGAGVLVFCGANAHLVYVAMSSQPDCVTHLKEPNPGSGAYRAAQSSC